MPPRLELRLKRHRAAVPSGKGHGQALRADSSGRARNTEPTPASGLRLRPRTFSPQSAGMGAMNRREYESRLSHREVRIRGCARPYRRLSLGCQKFGVATKPRVRWFLSVRWELNFRCGGPVAITSADSMPLIGLEREASNPGRRPTHAFQFVRSPTMCRPPG